MKRRMFSKEEKLAVITDFQSGKSIAEICREHGVNSNMVRRWQREYEQNPVNAFAGKGNAISLEARNAELEREVGRLHMELEFLKKVQQSLQSRLAKPNREG